MSKSLILVSLWLGLAARVFAADWTLTDGTSVSGEIVNGKVDDYGVMIHTSTDAYTTFPWAKFSQDSLKQLATDPRIKPFVDPFIAPAPAPKPEIKPSPVARMKSPGELNPSILGGLFHSSIGLFMLFVIYAANLYAAFEVAMVRGKPVGAVMGLSAVLPIAGPVIFLSQPMTFRPGGGGNRVGCGGRTRAGHPAGAGFARRGNSNCLGLMAAVAGGEETAAADVFARKIHAEQAVH